jgi:hypothetical protein
MLIGQQAVGQRPDDVDGAGGSKAAEQRNEQSAESSNAQWSEGATRGQDRAAEVRQVPQGEKEQQKDKQKQSKQKEDQQQKKQKKNKGK